MNTNRVTVRYAKAILELAIEQGVAIEVMNDFQTLNAVFERYKGFEDFLSSPGESIEKKFEKVQSIFSSQFHMVTINFIQLVFKKHREVYLRDIARNFVDYYRKHYGIMWAELITAQKIDVELLKELKDRFEEKLKVSLEVHTKIDEDLLGGFIFEIEGRKYDASLASTIKLIENQLIIK